MSPQLKSKLARWVDNFRHQLAYIDALPQLTLLGLACGIAAASIIVAFRLLIEISLEPILFGDDESFESLSTLWRFALPVLGSVLIGVCLFKLRKNHIAVSVSHVLDRLHNHQGVLPWRNVVVQFFAGAASIISGQSVGREGPAVHLGAGMASLLGQWLKLPHNSLRILVGCGVAAAIAASFNTPMAGVIFAMEVVLMEYTISGFIPVIIASVVGAGITQVVFGEHTGFTVSAASMKSLWELPFIVFGGILIAAVAALFYRLQFLFAKFISINFVWRMLIAGTVTGCVAIYVPQIMGVGYDTVSQAMAGQLNLQILFLIIAAKLFCTTLSIGLGMPGGLIGPTLVLGACVGGVLGIIGNFLFPEQASPPGFYVILGMAAMMAAVLNAPLAALVAILELTYNPNMIFAGMLMIVFACLTAQQVFKCNGIFQAQLRLAGTPIKAEPAQQILSRVGVASVMNRNFVVSAARISAKRAYDLLDNQPRWIVIEEADKEKLLLRAADLATFLKQYEPSDREVEQGEMLIDLLEIPAQRYTLQGLHHRASLYEAHLALNTNKAEAICVEGVSSPLVSPVLGILTKGTIENYYSR
jgi:H+/Cl- antiporter ClcA